MSYSLSHVSLFNLITGFSTRKKKAIFKDSGYIFSNYCFLFGSRTGSQSHIIWWDISPCFLSTLPPCLRLFTSPSSCHPRSCQATSLSYPLDMRSPPITGLKFFLLVTLLSSLIGRLVVWLDVSILYQVWENTRKRFSHPILRLSSFWSAPSYLQSDNRLDIVSKITQYLTPILGTKCSFHIPIDHRSQVSRIY